MKNRKKYLYIILGLVIIIAILILILILNKSDSVSAEKIEADNVITEDESETLAVEETAIITKSVVDDQKQKNVISASDDGAVGGGVEEEFVYDEGREDNMNNQEVWKPDRPLYVEDELLCLADSEEKAREIADLYNIELATYENGIALFHITDGREAVQIIREGEKNKWPELSINSMNYAQ